MERKIVGTWNAVGMGGLPMEVKTTYQGDGTYHAVVNFKGTGLGDGVLDINGTWSIQDDLLIHKIVTVVKTTDEQGKMIDDQMRATTGASISERYFPKGGLTSAKIVSVSETHLITQDPATGQSVAERVR